MFVLARATKEFLGTTQEKKFYLYDVSKTSCKYSKNQGYGKKTNNGILFLQPWDEGHISLVLWSM